ncbi:LysR family transcriptional regulator [Lichenibacterium ramalinae]|uniref:LysR family transcriptional regulator n=1 Tax=Lichenibacterium ramalinae TaxID=2316527 RepID=A0A4Q2R8T5_9HYPH|nr:LysR family transcriptional regulator [Lichenibacterium ramalinae]RYB02215.1 LysR family transcriptional regulator [Lichenibacterium ramalinae]
MSDPDLGDLQAFAAVARARSFRGAAALGGVSASSLSEALRRLEARVGVRLLNRTTRSVTPTEAGERLLARLGPALDAVSSALDVVESYKHTASGTLRLNVPTAVSRIVLPPILAAFLLRHPGIRVEVTVEDTFIDVLAAGFDAGIRYEERVERDMVAVPIGPRIQRFATAASPAYVARRGRPGHPRDLLQHECIRHRFASGAMPSWEFERGAETLRVAVSGPLVATAVDLEVEAALQGVGVISLFEGFLSDAFADGRLVPLLEDWWPSFSGPFLYYPGNRHMPPALRAFLDHLKTETRHIAS